MAEYDPTAPLQETYDAVAEEDEYQEHDQELDAADGEDDDYDPSSFADDPNSTGPHVKQDESLPTSAPTQQPSRPKTVGGFMVDDDEEDEEQQHGADIPPPSQLNGTAGAHSGLGAAAVPEAENTVVASEPSQDQASAPSTAPVNGSSSVVPAPVSDASSFTLSASAPALSLQSPIHQGKQEMSTTASAVQSAAATPQPTIVSTTAPPQRSSNGSVPPTSISQRLPHDKVGQLEDRIKEDPKADADAWRELIRHYREKGQLDNARKVYARFFEVFPSAAPMWVEHAQMELEENNFQGVEQIFGKCLLQLPNVDMWTTYLDYLRRIHPLINDPDGSKRGIISQAFDLLLDNVGIDPDSGKLWRDYVDFIRSGPGVMGGTGWQDAQKMDLLRKAYHKSVRLPHSELTKLWKEYDNFELSINKATGRKFLQEQSPHYMTARTARTQLEQKIQGLERTSLPALPPLYGSAGEDAFGTQVEKWRAWIAWEKEDPLVLKDDDASAYRKRIIYAYRQATMQLRFYPQIWFDAASWCFEQGGEELDRQGEDFLDKGLGACPESVLLALKKADRVESGLEKSNEDDAAIRNGEKLDPPFEHCHAALYALHDKMKGRLNKELAQVQEYFNGLPPEDEDEEAARATSVDEDDEDIKRPQTRSQQLEGQLKAVKARAQEHQDVLKRTISYLWVAKLRAFRRIQGQGNPKGARKGFRGVFAEARPRGQLTSEVYIASALMEWVCYQDKSAEKIFERGLKLFPTDEVFALEYIKHLISNNDDTNARAVFETTITKIVKATEADVNKQRQKCRPLMTYMHNFESNYGDIDKIHKLEKRMAAMFPDEPELARFGSRFALPSFNALDEQLIISPTQAIPKPAQPFPTAAQHILPTVEHPGSPSGSSNIRLGPNGPYIASPKRPLDDSDAESPQQRKFLRGDSPLKGAAGRRLQNQSVSSTTGAGAGAGGGGGFVTKNYVPPPTAGVAHPAPLPYEIHSLLSMLPNARSYASTLFDPGKMVELMRGVNLPGR